VVWQILGGPRDGARGHPGGRADARRADGPARAVHGAEDLHWSFKQLGAPTAQYEQLIARSEVDREDFVRASQVEKARRSQSRNEQQSRVPPAVNESLIGTRIQYMDDPELDGGPPVHWFSGKVTQVETDTSGKVLCLVWYPAVPALGWDEATECWVVLTEWNWNAARKGGWRLDLDYASGDDEPEDE